MIFLRRCTAAAKTRASHRHWLLSLMMSLQLVFPVPLLAHSIHTSRSSPDQTGSMVSSSISSLGMLDLTSSIQAVSAGFQLSRPTIIREGGARRSVNATDLLTAAEFVALQQVLSTGHQTLRLASSGTAKGGSFQLTPDLTQQVSSLVVPKGVIAVDDFARTGNLNLSGDLTNAGTFYAFSSSPAVMTASVSAANIFNQPGAVLTSVLPKSGLGGFGNLVSNLSLSLNATNNVLNAGTISSAGSLTATAGGSITNALPAGVTGAHPVMQAVKNVNVQAPSITNGGIIASQLGTVNAYTAELVNPGTIQALSGSVQIANLSGNTLTVDNSLGTIAAQDQVLFQTLGSTQESKSELSVEGGTISANNVSFLSPDGKINVAADRINGAVDVSGGTAEIGIKQGNLDLADVHLTGDPIFYAQGGSLDLSGLFSNGSTFSTAGGDFVALATGDITATEASQAATVDASSLSGQGGTIVLAAGVNFTVDPSLVGCSSCSSAYSIGGPSSTGGSINLPNVSLRTNNSISLTATGSAIIASIQTKGAGNVTVNAGGTFSAIAVDASAVGTGSGGSISVSAQTVLGPGAGPLTLSADGAATGNGGSITVVTSDDLAVRSGAGGLVISATGGSPGSTSGNGGTVQLTTDGNLTLDPGSLNVAPQGTSGNGGAIGLFVFRILKDLTIMSQGVLNASGVGNGNGGSINVITEGTVQVTAAGPVYLTANGTGKGNGGSISVVASGGDLVVGPGAGDFVISATGGSPGSSSGNGGSVTFQTFGGSLTVDLASLSVAPLGTNGSGGSITLLGENLLSINRNVINNNGVGNGNGGSIALIAETLQFPSAGPSILSANGAGKGNGGNILLVTAGDLAVGSAVGGFVISSTGGSPGSASGSGGSVQLTTDGNITLDVASLNVAPLGANGNGGSIELRATSGTVNIVSGTVLNASGVGSGSGGAISIVDVTLQLPAAGPLTLVANAAGAGNGGSVIVSSLAAGSGGDLSVGSGAGELVISATGGSTGSSSGNGGVVQVSAGGNLTVDLASLKAGPLGTTGNGGTIALDALSGNVKIVNQSVINASAVGNGTGGEILLFCNTLQVPSGGPFTLLANGAHAGDGGHIFVTIQSNSNLVIGSGAGDLVISATGGSLGSSSGNGGSVELTSSGNLTVDLASLNVRPLGTNGNGGVVVLNSIGILKFDGSVINNSGVGNGNGGGIALFYGALQLTQAGPFTLLANGAGTGNGGTVNVASRGDLVVGSGGGGLVISATGGSPGSSAGNGGIAFLSAAGNLTLDPASLNVAPLGTNGNGGFMILNSQGLLNITGTVLDASGAGNGSGGVIVLLAAALQSPLVGTLTLLADGAGTGNGGTVLVQSGGDLVVGTGARGLVISATGGSPGSSSGNGGIAFLSAAGNLTLDPTSLEVAPIGTNGNGGSILLSVSGNLRVNGGVLNASGVGNGNGGSILLNAATLQLPAAGAVSLAANGSGSGDGGSVSVQTTNTSAAGGDLVFGSGSRELSFSVSGGSLQGRAGIVNINAGGNLTFDEGPSGTVSFLNPNDQIISGGNLIFLGSSFSNQGNIIVSQAFNATSNGGPITLSNSGTIQAASLSVTARGGSATLDNEGVITTFGQVKVTSNGGVSAVTGGGSLSAGGGVSLASHGSSVNFSQASISGLATASAGTHLQFPTARTLLPPTTSTLIPAATGTSIALADPPAADTTPTTDKDTRGLIPIAFISPTLAGIKTFKTSSGNTLVKHDGNARLVEREPGELALICGEILVAAAEPATVKLGDNNLALAAGSVALVSMSESLISIRTLWDRGKNSVCATIRGRTWSIPAGHELSVGVDDALAQSSVGDNAGRRRSHTQNLGEGVSLVSSEVSLVGLMQSNSLLKQVLQSLQVTDRAIARKLLKMAACLMTATSTHGAYWQARF